MANKMLHKLGNLFKSKEQLEIEARMEFKKNQRSFQKYYNDLDKSIEIFTKMTEDAVLSGNQKNAMSAAGFVLKLQNTQTKVQGLLQKFEMMYNMQRLTGVMTNFMDACTRMGLNIDSSIDLKGMWKDTASLEMTLGKLDAMSDQMDEVFDVIDNGMNIGSADKPAKADSEEDARKLIDDIMKRHNLMVNPNPDDEQDRLNKLKQELGELS